MSGIAQRYPVVESTTVVLGRAQAMMQMVVMPGRRDARDLQALGGPSAARSWTQRGGDLRRGARSVRVQGARSTERGAVSQDGVAAEALICAAEAMPGAATAG